MLVIEKALWWCTAFLMPPLLTVLLMGGNWVEFILGLCSFGLAVFKIYSYHFGAVGDPLEFLSIENGHMLIKERRQKVNLSNVKYLTIKSGVLAAIVDEKGKEGLILDYHHKFDDDLRNWLKENLSNIPVR